MRYEKVNPLAGFLTARFEVSYLQDHNENAKDDVQDAE